MPITKLLAILHDFVVLTLHGSRPFLLLIYRYNNWGSRRLQSANGNGVPCHFCWNWLIRWQKTSHEFFLSSTSSPPALISILLHLWPQNMSKIYRSNHHAEDKYPHSYEGDCENAADDCKRTVVAQSHRNGKCCCGESCVWEDE
jgi:hypothetical protein